MVGVKLEKSSYENINRLVKKKDDEEPSKLKIYTSKPVKVYSGSKKTGATLTYSTSGGGGSSRTGTNKDYVIERKGDQTPVSVSTSEKPSYDNVVIERERSLKSRENLSTSQSQELQNIAYKQQQEQSVKPVKEVSVGVSSSSINEWRKSFEQQGYKTAGDVLEGIRKGDVKKQGDYWSITKKSVNSPESVVNNKPSSEINPEPEVDSSTPLTDFFIKKARESIYPAPKYNWLPVKNDNQKIIINPPRSSLAGFYVVGAVISSAVEPIIYSLFEPKGKIDPYSNIPEGESLNPAFVKEQQERSTGMFNLGMSGTFLTGFKPSMRTNINWFEKDALEFSKTKKVVSRLTPEDYALKLLDEGKIDISIVDDLGRQDKATILGTTKFSESKGFTTKILLKSDLGPKASEVLAHELVHVGRVPKMIKQIEFLNKLPNSKIKTSISKVLSFYEEFIATSKEKGLVSKGFKVVDFKEPFPKDVSYKFRKPSYNIYGDRIGGFQPVDETLGLVKSKELQSQLYPKPTVEPLNVVPEKSVISERFLKERFAGMEEGQLKFDNFIDEASLRKELTSQSRYENLLKVAESQAKDNTPKSIYQREIVEYVNPFDEIKVEVVPKKRTLLTDKRASLGQGGQSTSLISDDGVSIGLVDNVKSRFVKNEPSLVNFEEGIVYPSSKLKTIIPLKNIVNPVSVLDNDSDTENIVYTRPVVIQKDILKKKLISESKINQEQVLEILPIVYTKLKINNVLVQEQTPVMDTIIIQEEDKKIIPIIPPKIINDIPIKPEPKEPFRPKPFFFNIPDRFKSDEKVTDLFKVQVRKRGVFIDVDKGSDVKSLFLKGKNIASLSSVASFRLVDSKGVSFDYGGFDNLNNKGMFYRSKSEKNVFIEKPEFRIDSPLEKKEITFKGVFTNKYKGFFNVRKRK